MKYFNQKGSSIITDICLFYPPWRDHPDGDPLWGLNLISFSFNVPLEKSFLISKSTKVGGLFWSAEFFIVTDGWWWMVDKWWMVDGGWSKKKSYGFSQNFVRWSSGDIKLFVFRKLVMSFFPIRKMTSRVFQIQINLYHLNFIW